MTRMRSRTWIALGLALVPAAAVPLAAVAMAGGTPSFTREVAPDHRREVRRVSPGGRNRAVPARDGEADLRAVDAHRRSGAGTRHAALATGPPLSRVRRPGSTDAERAAARDPRRVGGEGREGRRPGASAHDPERPKVRSGEKLLNMRMQAAYKPSAPKGVTDDYRCFLLDPKQASDGAVTSVRIQPGRSKVVHHVILFRVATGQVPAAKGLDRESSGPGWSCFGGTGLPAGDSGAGIADSLNNANWIAAWAPGWGAGRLPDGTGVSLPAGSQIVMQVHYNLLNGNAPDRSRALLTVAPASAGLEPLQTMLLPGPVELACAKGESGPLCERNEALFDLARKYGGGAAFVPAGLLILCRGTAATPRADARSTCDRRIATPTTIRVAAGHMHLLGSSIRIELNPGTPRAKVLLDIPRWDFHWQNAYTLVRAAKAAPGDVVRVTCRHDVGKRKAAGSGAPAKPRYVLWGEGTTDEMCLGILQVTRG